MKKISTFLLVLLVTTIFAQAPADYYNGTTGLTGYALKTKLSEIISNGHRDRGYNSLYEGYKTTDTDNYYEKDGSVLDMYSENPNGADPYNYQHGIRQCGSYTGENNCYNREHIVPQSTFGERAPMVSDIHHIPPTDGYVNNRRSNFPFGVVTNPSWTSRNGSKVGPNTTSGYSGTVFEPIDAFKGDVARMIFYFATRYQNQIPNFSSGTILDGTTTRSISQWELNILLEWHANDPVSQREIDRNNAAYTYQGNRNPYIDNPTWVNVVWGGNPTVPDTQAPTVPQNIVVSNISGSTATVNWTASTDNVAVTGYNVYLNGVLVATSGVNSVNLSELTQNTTYSITIEAYDATGNISGKSTAVNFTTNTNPAPSTTCGTEDFETIPVSATNYDTRTWTSNGITWRATDARTDQTINNRAITIRNGELTSTTISGGISSLTVTAKQFFTGNAGNAILKINGVEVGKIPYNSEGGAAITTTISDINISGEIIITIDKAGTSTRVGFDDLSWTCYSSLSTNDIANQKKMLSVSPNPVRNGQLQILGLEESNVRVEIYSVTGQLVQTAEKVSKSANKINLRNLNKGVYILKAGNQTTKFIVE